MRIALYEHSSVARDDLRTILESLGASVLSLGRTNEFVPIDTEAVRKEDTEQAAEWAHEHQFDAIVSTDGDADRPLIGDEAGQWFRGDVVGVLVARALDAQVVVTPVSSNTALESCGWFERTIRTRIGSPFVIAGMEGVLNEGQGKSVLGYEANGGVLLGTDILLEGRRLTALPTRDAALPIIAILAMARKLGCKVSELVSQLPARFTHSDRLQDFATERSKNLLHALERDLAAVKDLLAPDCGELQKVDQTDGFRATFATGEIVHLRPSGNAPELRCYAEADSPGRAQSLCMAALERVRSMSVA